MKKKSIVIFLITCAANAAYSQITITQSDMPQPGDTIRLSTAIDTTGLTGAMVNGAGVTWNFSGLTPLSQTVDTFISPTAAPFAYQLFFNDGILYPAYKATVAQASSDAVSDSVISITNVVDFYKDQTASYENVGYGAYIEGLPTSVKDDTIDVVYKLPMTYGNADSCHSSNHVDIPVIGYYGQFKYRVNHVEGWGTIITPFGSFSALKVETLIYSSDSIYFDSLYFGFRTPLPEQVQYKWLANGEHEPVLQINETMALNVPVYVNTVYRDSARHTLLGVSAVRGESGTMKVYPNPSSGKFTIQSTVVSGQLSVKVYDVLGKQVYSTPLNLPSRGDFEIDLGNEPNGVYLYRVINESGELIGEGKVVVQR